MNPLNNYPTGTVTFLFTDIEGSTRLAREHPETWETARARHDSILHEAIELNNGHVFQIIGDSFCAAFHKAGDALKAATKAQQGLQTSEVSETSEVLIRVRMGIHTGEAEIHGREYHGYLTLSLVQRVMSAGHGGQILLSNVTENLLRDSSPKDVSLRDMGEHKLKDVPSPVRVFQVVAPGLQSEFPTLKTQDVHPNNLPAQLTDFIGREKELDETAEALAQNRLVTLIGSGGTGKTRLAIEAGAVQLTDHHFTNGVYFVALAPLENTEAIVPTVASALGFSFYEGGEPRQQLLDYLREKSMLLIMDNFEHLLEGAELVTDILNTAPKVKIIATSRARLNIQGEQLFHLSGMNFPNWEAPQDAIEYSAVKLFMQTARRVGPDFELTPTNLKYITRICRLVEGMPLGILLAASWMEMLTPEEIAAEIEKSLDFLETRQRDLPDRQHSMRAVFDYSWKLLTPGEQDVFMKSSVFRGGFIREAAQHVTGASLHDLMGLVDKSLLQRDSNGRYGIHELLRQYGAEKLSGSSEVEQETRDLHCAYFAEYLHKREPDLHGKDQRSILAEIEAEIENIRIGWNWAIEHVQVERLADMLESIAELHDSRGWSREGAGLFAPAEQKLSGEKESNRSIPILRGRLLMWLGIFSSDFDTVENVNRLFQTSLTILRESGAQRELAHALRYSAVINNFYAEDGNELLCQESLNIFKELGDRHGIALASKALSFAAQCQENYVLAKQRCQSTIALFRDLDNIKEIARCLSDLGYACWRLGEYQEARQYNEESLGIAENIGDQYGIAGALAELGKDAYGLKDFKQAEEFITASMKIFKEMGSLWGVAGQSGDLAEVMLGMKEYAKASQFAQEARDLYATVGFVGHNWELRISGGAALGMGDIKAAKTYLRQSLEHTIKVRRYGYTLLTMVEIVRLFVKQGKEDLALELLGLITNHRSSWQLAKDRAAELIAELEAKLPANVVAQAMERGRARDLEKTIQELLEKLKE